MSEFPDLSFRTADLPQKRPTPIAFTADATQRDQFAGQVGVDRIKKLSFTGQLKAVGKTDWALTGRLGATVQQPCVVTLDPVTTRIEEDVQRVYVADWQDPEDPEIEMPEDDTTEALGPQINVMTAIVEALSLAVPAYPRADGAELGALVHAEPGIEPLNDETVKPFAGLGDLKKKLQGDAGSD